MRISLTQGRRLALSFLATALLAAAATAQAASWSPDFNISGGDVNETITPLNGQRASVVDDSNNLYIAFFDNRNKNGNDNNFEIYFRRFVYNFGSPSITRVTNFYNPSKYPSLATLNWGQTDSTTAADSGRIYIAWQDARLFSISPTGGEPFSYTIFFRTFQSRGGVGFGPEIQVSPYDSLSPATAPVLARGDSSRVWIVWQKAPVEGSNPDLFYAIYNTTTRTMGSPQQLTNDAAFSGSATIAATRDGVVHVAWVDSRSGLQQIWTKRFVPGSGWTADAQLVFTTAAATLPSLTADYNGHVHLVWRDSRDGNNEIYYKEYLPGTGWSAAETRLTVDPATQTDPTTDADPRSNVYLVWTDQRNGPSNFDIYYKERKGGVWQPEVPLVYSATDTSNSVQQFPTITHDGVANLYVAWTDWRLPASIGKNKETYYKTGTGFVTGVGTEAPPPLARLLRNYPNPFNPATKITFRLERDAQTSLRVFDAQGRLVRTLMDSYVAAGPRAVEWDGRDDRGRPMASGTYYMMLQGGGTYLTKAVTLLK
jgi:flagellar hook capping protein FlgD